MKKKARKIVLSKEEILHLAKLANLKLTNKEINQYQKQLEETLDYIKNLQELDTDKIMPTDHTVHSENVFFADGTKNKRGLDQKEATKNSKNKKNLYFTVNRIL